MAIVSQKTDARNEIAWAWFVWSANKGIVRDATGWVLAPIGVTPEAFTTDIADVQGQFPIVYNTDRMPYTFAVHNTAYYYDSSVAGGTITTTVTTTPIGKGVVSEEGNYILLDLTPELWCADLTPYQEGINTPPLLTKSVLWDQPWSVPTVINVNTPIVVSTDPTQAWVLTNGTSIVIPKETTPFLVAIPSTQIVTDWAIWVYTNWLPFINFTYSNTSSRSQLIEFNAYWVIYTFLSSGAAQYEVKYDNYTKFLSSLPDENWETLFNQWLWQQNIAPAGLWWNIEQSYSFVFKKILNAWQSITFTLWSQIGNFSWLPTTNTVFSWIPWVTHKSFLVTPL